MIHARFTIRNFIHFLQPDLCLGCRQILLTDEQHLCVGCYHELPRTRYHKQRINSMYLRFSGVFPIAGATAWVFYQKEGLVQTLLHQVKYNGAKELAFFLGASFAQEFAPSLSATFPSAVLVPVPLHPNRLKQRGYNQAEWIARGIASVENMAVETEWLYRMQDTRTQTRHGRLKRLLNMEQVFGVQEMLVQNRNIVLVDDVCTTGATLLACAEKLLNAGAGEIWILSVATA